MADKAPFLRRFAGLSGLPRFVLIVAFVQAVFWLAISPLTNQMPNFADGTSFEEIEVATLQSPTAEALANARFEKVAVPWSDCCSGGYRAVRYRFSLDKVPPRGLIAANPAESDNFHVYVNGQFFLGKGRMDRANPSFRGNIRSPFTIPPAMLKTGENTLDAIVVRSAMPWFDGGTMIVGDPDKMDAAFSERSFQLNELNVLNMGVGLALAVLALILAVRSPAARGLAGWMAVLLVSTVLYIGFYRWIDPPFSPQGRLVYNFLLLGLQPVGWLGFLTVWVEGRWGWARKAALTGFALVMMVVVWALYYGGPGGFDLASEIADWFNMIVTASAILIVLWSQIRHGADHREWEAAVLLLCVTLLGYSVITELVWHQATKMMEASLVYFLLAFSIAFVARNVRLFQSQGQINALLQTQLDQRTSELEAAHEREKAMVMVQAHQAERQRIMRDMHDGLGSNLMSMLLMAKRGKVEAPVVADGLQTVIDEMRLMIDSMDSVGESLQSALSIFRERMQARVEGAGKHFEWHEEQAELPLYGPRAVLQVFRVMQEAVSNALKHSSGDRITITIAPPVSAAHALRIIVADNGSGLGKANARGRGMANMTGRASAIGADLSVEDTPQGVRIVLDLSPSPKVDD
jgi:signal transduction histidine kinase